MNLGWLKRPTPAPLRTVLPPGWSYLFDSNDVDGQANKTLASGSQIATWKSNGALGDATQATGTAQPMLRKRWVGASSVVSFDGTTDYLSVANSAVDLAFMHNTGVFDLIVVFRRNMASQGTLLGNANAVSESGFRLTFDNNAGNDRSAFFLYNGAAAVFQGGLAYSVPLGTWAAVEWAANGTQYNGSYTVSANPSAAFTGSLGAGNATNAANIGGSAFFVNPYGGDVALVVLYPRVLSAGEHTTVRALLNARYPLGLP